MSDDVKIGLALGGGAVRGAAHLGVLQALEEGGYKPTVMAGTSIGAFVAALYAFGKTPQQILELIRELEFFDIARVRLNKLGLMSHQQIGDLLVDAIGDQQIEDAPMPLAVMATDLVSGKAVALQAGSVQQAVLASTCIPALFTPIELEGRLLVDGGLVENVPVSRLAGLGANVVVGVNLNASLEYGLPDDLMGVLNNAIDIAIDTTTRIQMQATDVAIELALADYDRSNPAHIPALVEEGYRAGKSVLPQLAKAVEAAEPNILDRLESQARQFVQDYWPY